MFETMWNSDGGFSRPSKSCGVYDTRFSYTECTGWVEGKMWKTIKPIEQNKIEWKVYVFYMDGTVFFFFHFLFSFAEKGKFQRGNQLVKWKVPMKFEASGVDIFDTLYREIVRQIRMDIRFERELENCPSIFVFVSMRKWVGVRLCFKQIYRR